MSHWQVFETPLPGYAEPRFLRCAVWANAPKDALTHLHRHDRCWHSRDTRHIAIWEDNHKHPAVDGLVHWVVDARGHPLNGAVPEVLSQTTVAPPATQIVAQSLAGPISVPATVAASVDSLPSPVPTPANGHAAAPHNGAHRDGGGVARETLHSTDTIRQLAEELDALKAYIRGQTLADLAFQEHALLEHARRSGDVNLIKSAEASAASSFGPDWRVRIPQLLDKGRALDAAALQSE